MKQIVTLLLLTLGFYGVSLAQTMMLSPASVQVNTDPSVEDTEAHLDLINLTGDQITVKWERNVIEITENCQTQVCDPIACYLPGVSTKQFNLAGNDTALMILHLLNYTGNPASAIIELKMTNLSNMNEVDTVVATYIFNASSSTGNPLSLGIGAQAFPNPATDYIQLSNADVVAAVRLLDLQGRQVARINATPTQRYDIAAYPAGTYFLVLEDSRNQPVQVVKVSKQ